MINRQVASFSTAILTGVIVAVKDFFSREMNHRVRTFDHPDQTDDRRQGETLRYGSDKPSTIQY